jgi:hypothetical protein
MRCFILQRILTSTTVTFLPAVNRSCIGVITPVVVVDHGAY